MNKIKATKKEMTIKEYEDGLDSKFVVVDKNGNFFAKTYSSVDARLIASAPELLACLENLVDRGLVKDTDGEHYEEVLEAISKAKGQ